MSYMVAQFLKRIGSTTQTSVKFIATNQPFILNMKFPCRFLAFLAILSLLTSCKKGFDQTSFTPEEIGRYIAARVPAVIEPGDAVRIRFAVPVDTTQTT